MYRNLLSLLMFWFLSSMVSSAQSHGTSGGSPAEPSPPAAESSFGSFVLEVANREDAVYPLEAIRNNIQGRATVKVLISGDGEAESAEILTGNATLAESGLVAAKEWKFKTWKHKVYLPLRAWADISFDFHLPNEKPEDKAGSTSQSLFVKGTVTQSGELPQILMISPAIASRMLIYKVAPKYPTEARQKKVQGSVVLLAVISKKGAVERLNVLSGDPLLLNAAAAAVQRWRYRPYVLNGGPVEVSTQITVSFTLSGL